MGICQSVLNSVPNELQLNLAGNLDYKAVNQGSPTMPVKNFLLIEIPWGTYKWSPGAEVELSDYKDADCWDREGPEYMRWVDREQESFGE
jgi:hypothetical protein